MNKSLLSLVVMLALYSCQAKSETHVEGDIDGEIWTMDSSPYIIDADLNIFDLEILEGVEVRGTEHITVYVHGLFTVSGTEEHQVLFTEDSPNHGWGGFVIWDNPEPTIFRHAIIEHARIIPENPNTQGSAFNVRSYFEMYDCELRYNNNPIGDATLDVFGCEYIILRNHFHHNRTERWGSAVNLGGSGVFQYNLIDNNIAEAGSAICITEGSQVIDHCTFVNNVGYQEEWGTDIVRYAGEALLTNCIFWNTSGDGNLAEDNIENVEAIYCCVSDFSIPGDNQFILDPQFVDLENGDYRLLPTSPCIDAGDPEFELDPDGSITDLGCFSAIEGVPPGGPVFRFPELPAIPGQELVIPFIGENISQDMGVFAFEASILVAWEYLEFEDFMVPPCIDEWEEAGWIFDWYFDEESINIGGAGPTPIEINCPLLFVAVSVCENAPAGEFTELIIQDAMLNEGEPPLEVINGLVHFHEAVIGDVSLNGEVHAFDASLILLYLAEEINLVEIQQQLGEVSGDGDLSALDAALILAYSVGEIDEFPIEGVAFWAFGNGIPEFQPEITSNNNTFAVPITLSDANQLLSATIMLDFNEELLELHSATSPIAGSSVIIKNTTNGAEIFVALSSPVEEAGQLVELEFELGEDVDQASVLFNEIVFNEFDRHHDIGETVLVSSTDVPKIEMPTKHGFVSSYPNPFNSQISFLINLNYEDNVLISIFDLLGREVALLANGRYLSGEYSYSWNADINTSGIYIAKISVGTETSFHKTILLK